MYYAVKADEKSVRFFGRCEYDTINKCTFFNWSCSGFEFSFTGTDASAELVTDIRNGIDIADKETRAYLGVYVDNRTEAVAKIALDSKRRWYTLVEDLPFEPHIVKVVKLTECGYGRAAVTNIKVNANGKPVPTVAKQRRIEFIGDSITCGYGNECVTESSDFVTYEQNGMRSFAAMAAEQLNAEFNCVCASGNGILHDYGMNTVNLIPELYRYTDKMLSGSFGVEPALWDFNKFVPDVIVIKLGANDAQWCCGNDLPEEERTSELINNRKMLFCAGFSRFIVQVRLSNLQASIIVLYDSDTVLNNEIIDAVNQNYGKGDLKLYNLGVPSKRPQEGVGANGHWAVTTHSRVSVTLATFIKNIMKW